MALADRHEGHPIDRPISVHFNQTLSSVQLDLKPAIEGRWQVKKSLLGITSAKFVPAQKKLNTATKYSVKLKEARRVLFGKLVTEKKLDLVTEFAPGILSVTPLPGSKNIRTNQEIKVVFSQARSNENIPDLTIAPSIEVEKTTSSDRRTFTWKPKTALAQTANYQVAINSHKGQKKLAESQFETVKQPNITAATNKNYFYPEEKISVDFDMPMKTDKPAFACQCQGQGKWESPQKFTFTPTGFQPGKSYPYTVPKGLTSVAGGVRESDQSYAVVTPGAVQAVISGSKDAPLQTALKIQFDQPVKKETVQPRVSLEPKTDFNLAWKDNKTAMINLSKLDYQTTYTVNIAPGVEPERFGLASNVVQSGKITTLAQTIKLAVPVYRQAYALSCEESSLRMALAYRGVQASDMDILQRVGYSPRPLDKASNTWEDPNQSFVGNVNGSQGAKTGYGVYAGPIAKAARSFGRSAEVATGVSAGFLAQAIHSGNPVVIWGSSGRGPGASFSWNTPGGGTATGWVNQHARTLVGVVGKPSSPLGFYVNDPLSGQKYWSAGSLMADMNAKGNLSNQAVVVY